jgi:hypothetical protein
MTVWSLALSPDLGPRKTAVQTEWCDLLSSWTEENKSWLSTIGLGKAPRLSSKYVTNHQLLTKVRFENYAVNDCFFQGSLFGSCDVVLSPAIWRGIGTARVKMESKSPERRLQVSDRVCLGNSEI